MYWFQLWREFKLSIAEILSVFPNWEIIHYDKNILLLDNLNKQDILDKSSFLWWTIKIINLNFIDDLDEIYKNLFDYSKSFSSKFNYWLSIFWWKQDLKRILINCKKYLRENWISSRFVNKDFKNLTSAQIIWEKLISKWSDFNLFFLENDLKILFWNTIWIQDINSYSKRDFWKDRDMQIGMLPPKLSQIMINLWRENKKNNYTIYDPFVWLWTILIESVLMWNKEVYWSDLNENMVNTSIKNLSDFKKDSNLNFEFDIYKLNAKFINESSILKLNKVDLIITEWYLWEVMTKSNISLDRIKKQRQSLTKIYEMFFEWLKKIKFSWNIIICFPFWQLNKKNQYFEEIYEIINKYCNVINLFKEDSLSSLLTKYWSLLYKRENQLVWREIFNLKIK